MTPAGSIAGFAAYRAFAWLLVLTPRPLALALGRGLGRLAFRLGRRYRRIALNNLALAFGREKSPAEREAIARDSFANVGRFVVDVLKCTAYPLSRIRRLVDIEGREHLDRALAGGFGVLLFTAHYGNWELASVRLAESAPLTAIARTLDNRLIDRDLRCFRTRLGSAVVDKFGASRAILKALARNGLVGILIDQNVLRSEGVFVDFFGRPAGTTPGLATFHLKTNAPLLPFFCVPRGRRYLLRIGAPVAVPRGPYRDADVLKITQTCTKMIEAEIRREPGLWLWLHKRWQTRPAEESKS